MEEFMDQPLYEEEEWNIYNADVVEEMLEADGIEPHEEGFIKGYVEAE